MNRPHRRTLTSPIHKYEWADEGSGKIVRTQVEKTKGELIGEFHNKMVTTTVKELSPEGVRMEVNMEGEIKGKDFVRMRWLLDSLNEFCE